MKMFLVSDNIDTLTGIKLAGFNGVLVHTKEEMKNALDKALKDSEISILMVTQKIGSEFKELLDEVKRERQLPLIVDVPDRHKSVRDNDYIRRAVAEMVGLKM